jgi:rRNA processing protein Krr1/Pno1
MEIITAISKGFLQKGHSIYLMKTTYLRLLISETLGRSENGLSRIKSRLIGRERKIEKNHRRVVGSIYFNLRSYN